MTATRRSNFRLPSSIDVELPWHHPARSSVSEQPLFLGGEHHPRCRRAGRALPELMTVTCPPGSPARYRTIGNVSDTPPVTNDVGRRLRSIRRPVTIYRERSCVFAGSIWPIRPCRGAPDRRPGPALGRTRCVARDTMDFRWSVSTGRNRVTNLGW